MDSESWPLDGHDVLLQQSGARLEQTRLMVSRSQDEAAACLTLIHDTKGRIAATQKLVQFA